MPSQGSSAGVAMVGGWCPRRPQAVVSATGAIEVTSAAAAVGSPRTT